MWLLILKLILTPCLIGLVSLAGRRWGPGVSGWLTGLPLTSGPIALYLALERGSAFAAGAAGGTLAGLISAAAFCLVYHQLSFRLNWVGCMLGGWAGFLLATFIFQQITLPLLLTFLGVIGSLAFVTKIMAAEKKRGRIDEAVRVIAAPRFELAWRMVIATAFVLALTASAEVLGARLSGLIAPFPIFASILAVFTQRVQGAEAARRLLQGVVIGAFTFAVFFVCVGGLIEPAGPVVAFGCALLGAILAQGCSIGLVQFTRRRQATQP